MIFSEFVRPEFTKEVFHEKFRHRPKNPWKHEAQLLLHYELVRLTPVFQSLFILDSVEDHNVDSNFLTRCGELLSETRHTFIR